MIIWSAMTFLDLFVLMDNNALLTVCLFMKMAIASFLAWVSSISINFNFAVFDSKCANDGRGIQKADKKFFVVQLDLSHELCFDIFANNDFSTTSYFGSTMHYCIFHSHM